MVNDWSFDCKLTEEITQTSLFSLFSNNQNRDQYSHLLNDYFLPYQGHNSFREKYFSGVTKRIAKEEKSSQE